MDYKTIMNAIFLIMVLLILLLELISLLPELFNLNSKKEIKDDIKDRKTFIRECFTRESQRIYRERNLAHTNSNIAKVYKDCLFNIGKYIPELLDAIKEDEELKKDLMAIVWNSSLMYNTNRDNYK